MLLLTVPFRKYHFVDPIGWVEICHKILTQRCFFLFSIDEAIDARRRNRVPRHARGQPRRDPGSLASGFVSESEAGTSYAGSSYVDPTPADEPPSLSNHDGPEDEVRLGKSLLTFTHRLYGAN